MLDYVCIYSIKNLVKTLESTLIIPRPKMAESSSSKRAARNPAKQIWPPARIRLFCVCCVEQINKNNIRIRDDLDAGAIGCLREEFVRQNVNDKVLNNMTDMQLRNEWNKLRQLYDFRLKYLKAVKRGEVADFTSKLRTYGNEFQAVVHGPPPNFELLHQMFMQGDRSSVELDNGSLEDRGERCVDNNTSQWGNQYNGHNSPVELNNGSLEDRGEQCVDNNTSQWGDRYNGNNSSRRDGFEFEGTGTPPSASHHLNNQEEEEYQVMEQVVCNLENAKKGMELLRDIKKRQRRH